jgi:hypothetical protein
VARQFDPRKVRRRDYLETRCDMLLRKVNDKALEVARSMGLSVAINIIADPDLDEVRRPASTPTSAAEPGRC